MQVLPQASQVVVSQTPTQQGSQAVGVTAAQARDQIKQLTHGVPQPSEIDKQKAAHSKRLDGQLRYEEELLKMSQQQQTQLIYQAAEAQKRQACLAIEQQARQQELQLHQQCSSQMMGMQQELQNRKMLLEKQASELVFEYQQRKSTEEIMLAQFDANQKAYQMKARLAGQLQSLDKGEPERHPLPPRGGS